jgi:hypothetical protein
MDGMIEFDAGQTSALWLRQGRTGGLCFRRAFSRGEFEVPPRLFARFSVDSRRLRADGC